MFLVIKETHPKETLRCRSPRRLERNLAFFLSSLILYYQAIFFEKIKTVHQESPPKRAIRRSKNKKSLDYYTRV